ncbi:hypothetical protein [Nostoc sp. FACHB-888]|uniref:hypothetical protein n=1 Tax=Nostoc sp. FACHB-888 TaxID=2692842 RepID=UPI001F54A4D7|nr:hypothetical protein [Nostoc sp. FACHB-888]
MRSRQADLDNCTSALSESVADALEEKNIKQVKVLVQRYGVPQTITLRVFKSAYTGYTGMSLEWVECLESDADIDEESMQSVINPGAIKVLQAIALAQLCKMLEAQGRTSKLENSLELLSQLYQEYEQVKTTLQKELVKEVL